MASSKSTSTNGERDAWTQTMLDRASDAFSHDTDQRQKVLDDMRFVFVPGHQWDNHLKAKRRNKPNYEFNRVRQAVRRITGQQLKNKPQIKVRAVEDNDVETADVFNGLIKNIEVQSAAENAYDTAMQWATGGGYGVLRVVAEYAGDDTFDQVLRIKNVMNPLNWWCDPAAVEFDRSDARYWFGEEFISRSEFKRRWPKAEIVDFSITSGAGSSSDKHWYREKEVRIAEYWYVEHEKKKLYLLSDGSVVSAEDFDPIADEMASGVDPLTGRTFEPVTIKDEREVERPCVYSCLVSGRGKLEEPTKWGGTMIPIVPQWGDLLSIEGKQVYCGMARFARDAQTIHNFEMSTMVEVVAKLPNSPLMATPAMTKGLESYYERMGYDDPPVMLFNPDPKAPGLAPQRQQGAQLPAAMANLAQIATDEMKAVTGVYDASLGARSNESSGRAIIARQNEGEVSNFVYTDNQTKALKRLGEILVDAAPHYYDTERSIRILGEDNAEKFIRINQPVTDAQTGETKIVNDLSRGKYDVTVTVGKSFDTARMELAEAAQALSATPGPIGQLAAYMLVKSLDVPGMDEMTEAARGVLVGMGLLKPGENDKAPEPPPPNPKDVAAAEKSKADAENVRAKTEGQNLENAKSAAELAVFGVPFNADGQSPALVNPAMPGPGGMPPAANGAMPPPGAPQGF